MVALYGGGSSDSVVIFRDDPNATAHVIEPDGEVPPPRSFHTTLVFGDLNQYLLIFGGRNNDKLLNDLWLLDLTNVISSYASSDPSAIPPPVVDKKKKPVKGARPGGQGSTEACWVKLLECSAIAPRYLHSAFSHSSSSSGTKLVVFGGIGNKKEFSSDLWECNISYAGGKSSVKDFSPGLDLSAPPGPPTPPPDLNALSSSHSMRSLLSTASSSSNRPQTVSRLWSSQTHREDVFADVSQGVMTLSLSEGDLEASPPLYGAVVVPLTDQHSNKSVAVMCFGGFTNFTAVSSALHCSTVISVGHPSKMIVLEATPAVEHIRGSVRFLLTGCRDVPAVAVDDTPSRIEYPNGDVYEGMLLRGEGSDYIRHGKGKMTYVDGSCYEGDWQRGVRQGSGRLVADSAVYEGGFRDDLFNGQGELVQAKDGRVYRGGFRDGAFDGSGELRLDSGEAFKGQFRSGKKQGPGRLSGIVASGTSGGGSQSSLLSHIEGDWGDDELGSGYATSLLIDCWGRWGSRFRIGSPEQEPGRYTGELQNGLPNSVDGICIYVGGSEYRGGWRGGRRNGIGRLVSVNKEEYEGKWVANQRCGRGVWSSPSGEQHDGVWEADRPHGDGVRTAADGTQRCGTWREGLLEGDAMEPE